MRKLPLLVLSGLLGGMTSLALAEPPAYSDAAKQAAEHLNQLPPVKPQAAGHIDRSGRIEKGRASFYGKEFAHKKMADGNRLNPNADIAASKNLPLGSVARVKNLENGKSTTVRIEDRGPYVAGRIIDLTPKAANQIDITKRGVAPVEVKPITVPTPDGGVKLGAGAAHADSHQIEAAIQTTQRLASPPQEVSASR
ncbi:MAG TPA: septal ring lytic transglycosylase RlpA family protein [Rhodopila sp.]|nr:septal ring lytic transglycosylase RlpA family protein [Rhodopila sp.]